MTAEWVTPCTLRHAAAVLVPLEEHHAADLAQAAGSPETFRYFSRAPADLTEQGMLEFVRFLRGPAATAPFCVIDPVTSRPAGITTYLNVFPQHLGLEIGWTWYAPDSRGTRLNPACKLLLMQHAFEDRAAIRVCLKTDERNARSRAAILKLGASFEGVLRDNVIMPDGFRRSTAMYSVLEREWPEVRRRLEGRLRGGEGGAGGA